MPEEEKEEPEEETSEEEEMPEEEKEKCDPLIQDCNAISTEVKQMTKDRAVIDMGIRNLKTASEVFDDDRFKEIISDAEKLREEYDKKIKNSFKSFSICDKKKPIEETEEQTEEEQTVKAPETKEKV